MAGGSVLCYSYENEWVGGSMDGSLIISFVFMAGAILYSVYQLYFSKETLSLEQEIIDKMEARPIARVIRYLLFLAFNGYFANMFFDIGLMLWISFFSVITLGLLLIELKFDKSSIISVLLVIIAFLGNSLPNDYDSFIEYVSEQTEYKCLRIECVKVSEVIVEGNLETEVKIYSIQDFSFDWYLLFARGELILKDEDGNVKEFSGINIGGLWLLDK
ncbi:hypothetical protein [Mesobacillus sp. S13]|uniref:hypothetical protein n=1 Tax=Mesobacillus sp. S13 TaxID=2880221 RepID=UPI001CF5441F|nr:hypothetical protein [Mesobacillus sp. S13]